MKLAKIRNPKIRAQIEEQSEKLTPLDRFHAFIWVPPIPKGRPRFTRDGRAFTPPKTRYFERQIAYWLRFHMNDHAPIRGPIRVQCEFSKNGFELSVTPSSRPKSELRGDLDNYVKAILDAANGIVFEDDRQVVEIEATK